MLQLHENAPFLESPGFLCTFPTSECRTYMAEWRLFLVLCFLETGSTLSLAWFVLWVDRSQEQEENSSALGPTPRTHSGAKCRKVGGIWTHQSGSVLCSRNVCLQRAADSPDSMYRVQHSTKKLSRSKKSAPALKTQELLLFACLLSGFVILLCFTICDIYTEFSIQIRQITETLRSESVTGSKEYAGWCPICFHHGFMAGTGRFSITWEEEEELGYSQL